MLYEEKDGRGVVGVVDVVEAADPTAILQSEVEAPAYENKAQQSRPGVGRLLGKGCEQGKDCAAKESNMECEDCNGRCRAAAA